MAILRTAAACALLMLPLTSLGAERAPERIAKQTDRLADLTRQATSDDEATAEQAIAKLRAAGPAGLEAILSRIPVEQRSAEAEAAHDLDPSLKRAIDAVAAQRDACASRLYWYTDFNQALDAARETKRPIVALHLLGQLSEDLSCANSRFFRQVLYADPRVADRLRDEYVLYWRSVRPAPKVTIDFGDGRKLMRTITGNSIHYVLDSEGRLIDALPGMYAPEAFLAALERAGQIARATTELDAILRHDALAEFHRAELVRLTDELQVSLGRIGELEGSPLESALLGGALDTNNAAVQDIALWERLAEADSQRVKLHPASEQFVRRQLLQAGIANRLAVSKARAESPLLQAIAGFERSLHADTLRNEYVLHRLLHDWLSASAPRDFGELFVFNERVYAELFQAPLDDPWAGLHDPAVYTALDPEPESAASESASR